MKSTSRAFWGCGKRDSETVKKKGVAVIIMIYVTCFNDDTTHTTGKDVWIWWRRWWCRNPDSLSHHCIHKYWKSCALQCCCCEMASTVCKNSSFAVVFSVYIRKMIEGGKCNMEIDHIEHGWRRKGSKHALLAILQRSIKAVSVKGAG